MPALQTVNLGGDPKATAMGSFAKNFLGALTEGAEKRKNDEIFKRISDQYGPDGKPEDMLWDIIKSEGLSQEYKNNKAAEIVQYATLKNKKTNELTPYQKGMLSIRQEELNIKKNPKPVPQITPYQQANIDARNRSLNIQEGKNGVKDLTPYQKGLLDARNRSLDILEKKGSTITPYQQATLDYKYSELENKKDKSITPYQQALIDIKKDDQEIQRNKNNPTALTPYQKAVIGIKEQELKARGQADENKYSKITPYQQGILDQKDRKMVQDNEKPITPYQKKVLENAEVRLNLERQRLEQAAIKHEGDLPKRIDDYTTKLLKATETTLPTNDKNDLNRGIMQLMTDEDEPMGVNDAFDIAYKEIETRRQIINDFEIARKPNSWTSNQNTINQSKEQAYNQLYELYYMGVTSQKDLRSIASKGGWSKQEINDLITAVFKTDGRKPRFKTNQAKQSAEVSQQELDDAILFG